MLKTPFLATLFAVSLFGGAALAEKPAAVERLRARGDVIDKSYRLDRQAAAARAPQRDQRDVSARARPVIDRGASRVRCSDVGSDCAGARASSAHAGRGEVAAAGNAGRPLRTPAFLDKVLGSDRTNFNEAGEDQGMSSRAAKRAWSQAGGGAAHANGASGAAAKVPMSGVEQRARADSKPSDNRMSCNEAGECSMSSKAVKKEWAYQSIKAGTWKGPEAKEPSNAARIIKADKDQKAAAAKHN